MRTFCNSRKSLRQPDAENKQPSVNWGEIKNGGEKPRKGEEGRKEEDGGNGKRERGS